MDYKTKYLKYKIKYNKLLKEQHGGEKNIAKNIAEFINNQDLINQIVQTEEIFNNLQNDAILNMVINFRLTYKIIFQKLFQNIAEKSNKYLYLHNIVRKEFNMIDQLETKTYNEPNVCSLTDGTLQTLKYKNYPFSGLDTIKKKLLINSLPKYDTLNPITTYNYILLFVTDLSTNTTHYYLVLAEFKTKIEYSIKHSNLRVFLPDEWSNHENIDYGLIASGELKIDKPEKEIIYDFNSSSNIIQLLENKSANNCIIYKNFCNNFIDSYLSAKKVFIPTEQLFSTIYLYIINHLVNKTITYLISLDSKYVNFKAQIFNDYIDRSKLLSINSDERLIFTLGLLADQFPKKLGGLHDYTNIRCYTNDELKEFNNNTVEKYNDLDDTNIDMSKLNCIKIQGQPVKIDSGDSIKDNNFINSGNCN